MAGVGGVNVPITGNSEGFKKAMASAQAATKKFGKSTVNLNRNLKSVGKSMNKMGRSMSMSLTAPILALGAVAVKTFASFEQEMAKVKAVSGATGKEFKALENLAQDLGASTRFTASEVATLQLNYSKLGFVPAEIQKITGATLNLALATGEDLANSAEVAGATLRGLGMQAGEMPRVVDVMAASFSSSALDLDAFKESMKLVAPTAAATGRDLETTTAMLGLLANNGIKGSIAGTQLNRVFVELNKKGINLDQALGQVANSSNGLATATDLVGDRGAKALLILSKQRSELGQYTEDLRKSKGAAETMAAIMDDTLQGSLLRVQSALEGAAIELGEVLAPVIKRVGAFIAGLATKFQELSPAQKKIIVIVGALVAAIGPLLLVLGFLATTILPAVATAFTTSLGPIGLIITAIGVLATTIYMFWDEIVSTFVGARAAIMKIGENIANGFRKIPELMFEAWIEFPKAILDSFKDLGRLIAAVITGDFEAIPGILKSGAANVLKTNPLGGLALKMGKEFGVGVADEFVTAFQGEMKDRSKEIEEVAKLPDVPTGPGPTLPTAPSGGKKDDGKKEIDEQAEAYKKVRKAISDAVTTARLFGDEEVTIAEKMDIVRSGIESAIVKFGENSKVVQALKMDFDALGQSMIEGINLEAFADKVLGVIDKIAMVMDSFSTIATQRFKNQEIAMENRYKKEVDLINNSKKTQEQKDKALAKLNDSMEKERSALAVKRAKAEKAQALMTAIVNTAASVTKVIANPLMAVLVAALGAAQIATIAAQPIPALAEGGLAFGETLSVVGDNKNARVDPEVIAPLSKLKDLISFDNINLTSTIRGEDLILVTNRTNANRGFIQ